MNHGLSRIRVSCTVSQSLADTLWAPDFSDSERSYHPLATARGSVPTQLMSRLAPFCPLSFVKGVGERV